MKRLGPAVCWECEWHCHAVLNWSGGDYCRLNIPDVYNDPITGQQRSKKRPECDEKNLDGYCPDFKPITPLGRWQRFKRWFS